MERWATFDCYGTLIDWNGGIGRQLERLFGADKAAVLLHAYHEVEPEVQREAPERSYRDVLTATLVRLAEREKLPLAGEEHDALARRSHRSGHVSRVKPETMARRTRRPPRSRPSKCTRKRVSPSGSSSVVASPGRTRSSRTTYSPRTSGRSLKRTSQDVTLGSVAQARTNEPASRSRRTSMFPVIVGLVRNSGLPAGDVAGVATGPAGGLATSARARCTDAMRAS